MLDSVFQASNKSKAKKLKDKNNMLTIISEELTLSEDFNFMKCKSRPRTRRTCSPDLEMVKKIDVKNKFFTQNKNRILV